MSEALCKYALDYHLRLLDLDQLVETLGSDRDLHAVADEGPGGVILTLYDLQTGQSRQVRAAEGAVVDQGEWEPPLTPGQMAARQFDRCAFLFLPGSNEKQRSESAGERPQSYHYIVRGRRACSLEKVSRWIANWNDERGPALALVSGAVVLADDVGADAALRR